MGDAWDDDEFDVPSLVPPKPPPSSWDDEEEEEVEVPAVKQPTPQELATQKKLADKKAKAALLKKNAALMDAMAENETAEDRKLRERQQVEDADHELTDELFGGGIAKE